MEWEAIKDLAHKAPHDPKLRRAYWVGAIHAAEILGFSNIAKDWGLFITFGNPELTGEKYAED